MLQRKVFSEQPIGAWESIFNMQVYVSCITVAGLAAFSTGQLEAWVVLIKGLVVDPHFNNDPSDMFACKPMSKTMQVWWKWGNSSTMSECAGWGWDDHDTVQKLPAIMTPNLFCWEHDVPPVRFLCNILLRAVVAVLVLVIVVDFAIIIVIAISDDNVSSGVRSVASLYVNGRVTTGAPLNTRWAFIRRQSECSSG